MFDIASIIKTLELNIQNASIATGDVSLSNVLMEYRTIGLRLPRNTGKTTFLANKFCQSMSMLFVSSMQQKKELQKQVRSQLYDYIQILPPQSNLVESFVGKSTVPLDFILIDGYASDSVMLTILGNLSHLKMITSSTIIIQLQT